MYQHIYMGAKIRSPPPNILISYPLIVVHFGPKFYNWIHCMWLIDVISMWEGDPLHPSISSFLISFEMCMSISWTALFPFHSLIDDWCQFGWNWFSVYIQRFTEVHVLNDERTNRWTRGKSNKNSWKQSKHTLLLTSLSILTAARLGYWALVRADRGWLTSSELPISVTTTEINYWQFSIHICSQKQKLNKHIFN